MKYLEDFTLKKGIALVILLGLTSIPSHYMYCEWRGGVKYTPRSCKVVKTIVEFVMRMP